MILHVVQTKVIETLEVSVSGFTVFPKVKSQIREHFPPVLILDQTVDNNF